MAVHTAFSHITASEYGSGVTAVPVSTAVLGWRYCSASQYGSAAFVTAGVPVSVMVVNLNLSAATPNPPQQSTQYL